MTSSICKKAINTTNSIASSFSENNLKYYIGKIPFGLSEVKEAVSQIWSSTKDFFKSIEPYQPLAATATILGKAIWKSSTRNRIAKEIKHKINTLFVLQDLHNSKAVDCSLKIDMLQREIREKKDSQVHSFLSVLQLGSLLFPHPGSNVYNSLNALSGRIFATRNLSMTEAPLTTALSLVSAAGITASILKQTSLITGDASLCHLVLGASFIGMGIETGIMIKNWIQSLRKTR